jgi:hypothetical protein
MIDLLYLCALLVRVAIRPRRGAATRPRPSWCVDPFLPEAVELAFPEPEEELPMSEPCELRNCAAIDCQKTTIDDETFCGFCAGKLHAVLVESMAGARARQDRVLHASLVRLAVDQLAALPAEGESRSPIKQHGRPRP